MDIVLIIFLNFISVFYVVEIQQTYLSTKFKFFETYPGRLSLVLSNGLVIGIVVCILFQK